MALRHRAAKAPAALKRRILLGVLTGLPPHAVARIECAADALSAALNTADANPAPATDHITPHMTAALEALATLRADVND